MFTNTQIIVEVSKAEPALPQGYTSQPEGCIIAKGKEGAQTLAVFILQEPLLYTWESESPEQSIGWGFHTLPRK